jgi:hypothetical protein
MPDDHDSLLSALRIVNEPHSAHGHTQTELDAAWFQWIGAVPKVDERTLALLRAAFEAGYIVAKRKS